MDGGWTGDGWMVGGRVMGGWWVKQSSCSFHLWKSTNHISKLPLIPKAAFPNHDPNNFSKYY